MKVTGKVCSVEPRIYTVNASRVSGQLRANPLDPLWPIGV